MKVDPRSLKGLSRFLAPSAGGPMADRALRENLITAEQLQLCIDEQDRSGRPLDELLVERGYLKKEDVERLRAPAVPAEVIPWISDPDRLLGHYVLVSLLGTGGMAEVWKAWDRSLGRWVAVKYLKREIGHPAQRIEREGRMAGQLSHPSIITIFERGLQNGRAYLVMPFVDGQPPRTPLPPREAARLTLEVARALTHAHQAGIIHRDVKPANILVEAGGRVVLADFGLAILDDAAASRWAMSGTPEYASPEQIRGDSLDARTDVYSLGATLYHFLSGNPPFGGTRVEEITEKVLTVDPPPLRAAPRALARVVCRAMARDREKRYPGVAEVAADLESWIDSSRPGLRLKPWWIGVAILSAVLPWAATLLILLRSQQQGERQRVLEALRDAERKFAQAERRHLNPPDGAELSDQDIRSALADFSLALRWAGGREAEAQYGIGRCYQALGDDRRAEEAFIEAGDLPAARSALAWLWVRHVLEGMTDQDWKARLVKSFEPHHIARLYAEGKWEPILASRATDRDEESQTLVQGAAAVELGRWEEARRLLDAGLRLRQRDATLLYYKARALKGAGDPAAALALWKESLRVAPKDWALRSATVQQMAGLEQK
jgi:tetratricopeptide (TPR) repeat protein